jgi:predicted Zn-dependent protease
MFDYLAGRGGRKDELAFILGHELAHTVAQHLVQRYEQIQRQQMIAAAIATGVSAITRNASTTAQQLGRAAVSVTGLLQQVALSGYSQQQELEADQLGIRYVMRAGYDPHAALEMLKDFAKFDSPSAPMLRTHPYIDVRREYLERYLAELDQAQAAPFSQPRTVPANATPTPAGAMPPANLTERSSRPQPEQFRGATVEKIKDLQDAQKLYPKDSVSWKNLQQEIDRLQRRQ